MESREDDTTPVKCQDCGWQGQVKDCVHSYRGVPMTDGDVEAVDQCPLCGNENVYPQDDEEELVPA